MFLPTDIQDLLRHRIVIVIVMLCILFLLCLIQCCNSYSCIISPDTWKGKMFNIVPLSRNVKSSLDTMIFHTYYRTNKPNPDIKFLIRFWLELVCTNTVIGQELHVHNTHKSFNGFLTEVILSSYRANVSLVRLIVGCLCGCNK